MAGHLFIVHGDLTAIACDAILVPTDEGFSVTESWDSLELDRPDEQWHDRKAIRHRTNPHEPEIWLGNIGKPGHDNEFAVYEPAIDEFVERAKAEIALDRDGRNCAWPKLRLAVNAVGSDRGGARTRQGELMVGLVDLLRRLTRVHDVDIILTTFGDKAYAAAQRARRQILSKKRRPELDEAVLKREWRFERFAPDDLTRQAMKLAEVAIDDRLVLFIGAGSSAGAGVPQWKQLLRDVAQDRVDDKYLRLLEERDLRDWATLIDRKVQPSNDIRDLVADRIRKHARPSLQHALLASLPSTEAVTTNFDQLFELACRVAERDLSVLPSHPRSSRSAWLLKLHGSVDNPGRMVLTRSDYLEMPRNRGALMGLVQGLLLTRHMLYVGYSLTDEDFHELIHEVRAARGDSDAEPATMITLAADQTQHDLWERDLNIISMDVRPSQTPERVQRAARQVEVFLDLVGFCATTSAAFFLDANYSALSIDESDLRESLITLAKSVRGKPKGTVAARLYDELLQLGLQGQESGPRFTERVTLADQDHGRIRIRRDRAPWLSGGPVECEVRGTPLTGTWRPNKRSRRCGVLQFDSPKLLASLVEPGERLKIVNNHGLLVLHE